MAIVAHSSLSVRKRAAGERPARMAKIMVPFEFSVAKPGGGLTEANESSDFVFT
jgi:hypothetical protein